VAASTAAVDRDCWCWRVCAGQSGDRGIVRSLWILLNMSRPPRLIA